MVSSTKNVWKNFSCTPQMPSFTCASVAQKIRTIESESSTTVSLRETKKSRNWRTRGAMSARADGVQEFAKRRLLFRDERVGAHEFEEPGLAANGDDRADDARRLAVGTARKV